VNINILLVRSIKSTKPVSQMDLVGNQLFYLISEINAEKRNNQDDKSGLRDPTSVSDFQRTKSEFRLDSRRDSGKLEVHYIEKRLDF
jgi:hypothetical protein